jgi:hypothetical protein
MRHRNGNYIPFSMSKVPESAWDTIFKKTSPSIFDKAKQNEHGEFLKVSADGEQRKPTNRRKEEPTEDDMPEEVQLRFRMPEVSREQWDTIFGNTRDSHKVGKEEAKTLP